MCRSSVCIIQWIVFVPTLAVGFPLNLAALYLLFFRIRRLTESTVYLSSLIFNDSLLIFSLPFKIYAYNNSWDLSTSFCSFLESLVFVNIYVSIVFIVCISGDRFVSLQFPFNNKRLRSPGKAVLICLGVWVTIFVFTLPVYNLHTQNENDTLHNSSKARCFENFSNETWKKKWIIVTMESTFLISTVSMVFFSLGVMRILRELRRRNPMDEKLRHNKSVKIVLCNLVAFLLCFIPYHVAAFTYFMAKNYTESNSIIEPLRNFVHISTTVSSVNCLTDGVCYYLILKEGLLNAQQERRRISIKNTMTMSRKAREPSVERYTGD